MSVPIRFLVCLSCILFVTSCRSGGGDNSTANAEDSVVNKTQQEGKSQSQPRTRNQLTDSMLAQIINYYQKEYGTDSVHMKILRTDTIIEVSFVDTMGGPDDYHGTLFVAYISVVKDIKSIVGGDMNGDGKQDMLVSVYTEGGGGGGNVWWHDHFLFLADAADKHILSDVKSDGEIMGGSGYFFSENISDGAITGIGNDYAEDDGHCCPSLYYRLHITLKDGQLSTVNKTAIEKPKGF